MSPSTKLVYGSGIGDEDQLTHGHRSRPTTAPPSTSQVAFTRQRRPAPAAASARTKAGKLVSVETESFTVTAAINATELMFTASRKAAIHRDRRSRGNTRPSAATKMKDGRKIPAVATTAPGSAPRMEPMNGAVLST